MVIHKRMSAKWLTFFLIYQHIYHSSVDFNHSSDFIIKPVAGIKKSSTFAPELIKELIISNCNSIGY